MKETIALKQQKEKLLTELKQLKLKNDRVSSEVQQLHDEHITLLKKLVDVKADITTFQSTQNKNAEKKQQLTAELAEKAKQLKELTSEINSLTLVKAQLAKAIEDANSQLAVKKDDLFKREQQLKQSVAEFTVRVAKQNKQETLFYAEQENLSHRLKLSLKEQDELAEKQKSINKKEEQLAEKLVEALEIKQKLHAATVETKEETVRLANKVALYNTRLADIDNREALLNKAIESLAEQVNATDKLKLSLERNIKDLETRKKKLEIIDLKIKKLAYEHNLDKEYNELKATVSI